MLEGVAVSNRICNIRTSLTGNYQITNKFCLNLIYSLGGVFSWDLVGVISVTLRLVSANCRIMAEFEVHFDKLNQNTEH